MGKIDIISTQLEELEDDGTIDVNADNPRLEAADVWRQAFPATAPNKVIRCFTEVAGDTSFRMELYAEQSGISIVTLHHGDSSTSNQNFMTFALHGGTSATLVGASFNNMGKNTAKRYLHEMVRLLRAQGFESIDLAARRIGSYAWAKFGFLPDENEWKKLKRKIHSRFTNGNDDTIEFNREHYRLIAAEQTIVKRALDKHSEPEMLWRLVDTLNREIDTVNGHPLTVGKALLIGQEWDGTLDIRDSSQGYRRFRDYIESSTTKEMAR